MTVIGIDHVQVAAPPGCESAARRFYGGLLRLEEIPKPGLLASAGGCWFRAGTQELHVGVEERFVPAQKAHPGFLVDDLDRVVATLGAAGHPAVWDARIPGVRRAYVDDPFGNRVELRQG